MNWIKTGYAIFVGVLLGTVMAACQPSSPSQPSSYQERGQKQEATPRSHATSWPEPLGNTPTLDPGLHPQLRIEHDPRLLMVRLQPIYAPVVPTQTRLAIEAA